MKKRVFWNVMMLVVMMFVVLLTASFAIAKSNTATAVRSDAELIAQLMDLSDGKVQIAYHDETGLVRFMGVDPANAIAQPANLQANASPEAAARGFLAEYGQLFGVKNQAAELTVMKAETLEDGRSFVRFQQVYQGVPVVAGELIVQVNAAQDVVSANGEILPALNLSTTPAITAAAARETAVGKVVKGYGVTADSLTVTEPALWLYHPMLLEADGFQTSSLVWRMEVKSVDVLPIRELVLVDAQAGFVTFQLDQIAAGKNRVIYDNNNVPGPLPGNGPVRVEGGPATGVTDVNLAYDYAGHTYDFFLNNHGRDSLDGQGMALISTVRYCPDAANCPFANAFWDGTQMAYGDGYASADDVVGHELTHGVTDFSSELFYYQQSGAMNESFSDVWGEFIDLTNGMGNDTPGVRWYMGEDIPIGAIRNMANPPEFSDPDSINSPNYYCGDGDNGGVHFNSGVNNKAVFLMTDGGSFNGQTVTGLGIPKVADLYYEVEAYALTSGSNYRDLYNALIQASFSLGFTSGERQEVLDALTAVEMSVRPCGDAAEAPICPVGFAPIYVFYDDLEAGGGNWTTSGSGIWTADFGYASSGTYMLYGANSNVVTDGSVLMGAGVTIPANAYLRFRHDWGFEDDPFDTYDGGVVEYSANGGAFTDAGGLFIENGYNGTISSSFGNPLGGRDAFVDDGHGYTASRLNLAGLAGQNVRFQFRIGTDTSFNDLGWVVDDVTIYSCLDLASLTEKSYIPIIRK